MDCVISFEDISFLRSRKSKIVTGTLSQKALKCVGVYIFKFILNIDKNYMGNFIIILCSSERNHANFLQELLQAYFGVFRICFEYYNK